MSYIEERLKEEVDNALNEFAGLAEEMADETIAQKENPTIRNLTGPTFSVALNKRLLYLGFKINLLKSVL